MIRKVNNNNNHNNSNSNHHHPYIEEILISDDEKDDICYDIEAFYHNHNNCNDNSNLHDYDAEYAKSLYKSQAKELEDEQIAMQLYLQEQENFNSTSNNLRDMKDKILYSDVVDDSHLSASEQKKNRQKLEFTDPIPDVRQLFLYYNKRFFDSALDSVEVIWSKRMTLCAGLCKFKGKAGGCQIALSEPLLKLRPREDTVCTLLHEMIHAYLFVTEQYAIRDGDGGHGSNFQSHMRRINVAMGTNITIYHTMRDEVDHYQKYIWRCNGMCRTVGPWFGYVKRSMNRPPQKADSWWDKHQTACGGTYEKIAPTAEQEEKEKQDKKAAKEKLKHNNRNNNSSDSNSKNNNKSSNKNNKNSNKSNTIPPNPNTERDLMKLIEEMNANMENNRKKAKNNPLKLEDDDSEDSDVQMEEKYNGNHQLNGNTPQPDHNNQPRNNYNNNNSNSNSTSALGKRPHNSLDNSTIKVTNFSNEASSNLSTITKSSNHPTSSQDCPLKPHTNNPNDIRSLLNRSNNSQSNSNRSNSSNGNRSNTNIFDLMNKAANK